MLSLRVVIHSKIKKYLRALNKLHLVKKIMPEVKQDPFIVKLYDFRWENFSLKGIICGIHVIFLFSVVFLDIGRKVK